jgi:prepilin-type N-terminal cleavage/methylation domain-containing protein
MNRAHAVPDLILGKERPNVFINKHCRAIVAARQGFTLIELAVVMIIIGLLIGGVS